MAAKGGVTTVIASGKGADALLQVVAGELGPQRLRASQNSKKTLHMHAALLVSSAWCLPPIALMPQIVTCGLCRPTQAITQANPLRCTAAPAAWPVLVLAPLWGVTPVPRPFLTLTLLLWVI